MFDSASGYLPEVVKNWAELESDYGGGKGNTSLSYVNDVEGKTFYQIADIIEKEF